MRRRKKSGGGDAGAPAWMVTYGDLMSLLLCFFIMLAAMSSISESKYKKAVGSLLGALGVMTFDTSAIKMEQLPKTGKYEEEIERIREEFNDFEKYIEEEGLQDAVEIVETDEGMLIRMEDPVLFPSGESEMNEGGREILRKLSSVLLEFDSNVRIEGHTDDVPISTPKFPSNWELSAERAVKVLKYINGFGVPGKKLTAIGRGEYSPLVDNTTPENRSKNRRVEIFVDYKARLKKENLRGVPSGEGINEEENDG